MAPLIFFLKGEVVMFDAKIQQIVEQVTGSFGSKLDDKILEVESIFDEWAEQFDSLSRQAKIAIGVSLGLSIADTILLFAILMRLGR